MNVFEKVNNLTAAQILERVHLDTAADGRSYVCPNPDCRHGKGGDGIKPQMYNGQTIWHCYGACGKHYTNSDLVAMSQGVDADLDKARAAEVLSELFGIESDDDDFVATRNYRQSARAKVNSGADNMDKDNACVEPKNFSGLYKFCRGNVAKFLAERGGQFRGFKPETFKKFGIGVHDEFEFPSGQGKGAAIIIPYVTGTKIDEYHFVARSVEELNGERGFAQIGKEPPLFEPMPLVTDGVNFICESATDALSIAQVFDGVEVDVGCVASSGASKRHAFIKRLNERFANAERRPRFIVAFDNDETGIADSKLIVDDLRKAGYPATVFFFEGEPSGTREFRHGGEIETVTIPKVDANDLLQQGGGKLFERLFDAITQTTNTLDEQATAIQAAQESMKVNTTEPTNKVAEPPQPPQEKPARAVEQSGIASISLGEYFKDKFLLDVAKTGQYSTRKTGFSNLDGDAYGNKVKLTLVPGLYLLGGLPSVGKSTFTNQLVEQLADAGEYCIFCSYEMTRLEMFTKSLSRKLFKMKRAGHDVIPPTSFDIRRGYVNHLPEVQNAVKELCASTSQLHIAELSNTPVKKLFEWLKPRIASATKSPVVVLDYLQILPSDKDNRRESLDDTLRSLKDFQRETDATFIVISSFNRANYWQDVSFESFKESGGLEYSADALLGLEVFVNVPETNDAKAYNAARKKAITAVARQSERTIKLSCLKNRNGAPFECYFRYYAAHDYFESVDEKAAKFDNAATACDDDTE